VRGRVARWPGYIDRPREFVYVDDAAEAMVRVSRSEKSWGEAWHVPGPATTTAKEFVTMAFQEAGAEPRVEEMGQIGHYMRGWFSTVTKQERELFYLFDHPIVLDGAKFARAFGRVPTTPYRDAIRPTVAWWREHLAKG
jgi:nucleoside-diphosphate-sugar epimerase